LTAVNLQHLLPARLWTGFAGFEVHAAGQVWKADDRHEPKKNKLKKILIFTINY
jgi:hypothetical protein